ncbi:MarR family winged helix-turn-helix transcriptional regulator [Faecalitalea cylindroides]|uniref:MarR family winged helix-turn-helix transcriptional regulator n=1 Tax=Faecalitalea cylindroides TaxID=39483 RepID=UPI0039F4B2B0
MNNRKYGYGFYFRCIQSQLEKAMNEQLKEFDLTKSQLDILRFLKYVKKDRVNQKDIEEFFHISNPTVTGLLNRMEQKGYVVRIHSPDDKRIRYIQITDKVEDIDKKIKKHIDYSEGVIAKDLSQEERNLLFKLLAKVKDNLIKEEENHVKDID